MLDRTLQTLIEKYPNLKKPIEQAQFLLGYTNGCREGSQVTVFLFRSPWSQFCLQATACGILSPGGVLMVTDELQWSPESHWYAYSLVTASQSLRHKSVPTALRQQRPQNTPLVSLAAEIATEAAKHSSRPIRGAKG